MRNPFSRTSSTVEELAARIGATDSNGRKFGLKEAGHLRIAPEDQLTFLTSLTPEGRALVALVCPLTEESLVNLSQDPYLEVRLALARRTAGPLPESALECLLKDNSSVVCELAINPEPPEWAVLCLAQNLDVQVRGLDGIAQSFSARSYPQQ